MIEKYGQVSKQLETGLKKTRNGQRRAGEEKFVHVWCQTYYIIMQIK